LERSDWPILIIGLAEWLAGATRLQKYAFLASKTLKGLVEKGFYNDWIASKYGPFSPSLAADMHTLIGMNLVAKFPVKNEFGYSVDRFALTNAGTSRLRKVRVEARPFDDGLAQIIRRYKEKSLMDILHDVYYQFPQYALTSSIKPKVASRIYESDSYLNPLYDEPDVD
jgi:uncharacterized protein YwgA